MVAYDMISLMVQMILIFGLHATAFSLTSTISKSAVLRPTIVVAPGKPRRWMKSISKSESASPLQAYKNNNKGLTVCKAALQPQTFRSSDAEHRLLRRKFPKFPWYRLPNWLTYCRCAAIPLLIVFFYMSNQHVVISSVFGIASATDYLDGYLARRWDVSSDFGAFLDPVVSKYSESVVDIIPFTYSDLYLLNSWETNFCSLYRPTN
jgi:CDP-alcohol phosphatidyltransferase